MFLGRKTNLVILCYHSIGNDDWRFTVSFNELKKQITYLKKDFTFISVDDLNKYLDGKKKLNKQSVLLTFDDGYQNLMQTNEYFKKMNINPVLFVVSEPKNINRTEVNNNLKLLTIKQIKILKQSGWVIGNHSATHANFKKLNAREIKKEVVDSKSHLERLLHFKVKYFSYPKGVYNKSIIRSVEKTKYSLGFSMDDTKINNDSNLLILPRVGVDKSHSINEFKATISPSVILFRSIIKKTYLVNFI